MLQVYNTFIIYNFNAQGVAISILILNIAVNLEYYDSGIWYGINNACLASITIGHWLIRSEVHMNIILMK